jgi:3-phosphoshikimate 1-carboxyvinyltransferase
MRLNYTPKSFTRPIDIPGSKSITNRLLVLKQLYFPNLEIGNASNSTDSNVLQDQIDKLNQDQSQFYVEDGGTTLRFLLCLLARNNKSCTIRCGATLLKRPHEALIASMTAIGFNITQETYGFRIEPIDLSKINTDWPVDISLSSQFATALALIAPSFGQKITIHLVGPPVSQGYLDLTLGLMHDLGATINRSDNEIHITPITINETAMAIVVESDWSGISYFVIFCALLKQNVQLNNVHLNSLQPDKAILKFASLIGIDVTITDDLLTLKPNPAFKLPSQIERDYTNSPDIALTEKVGCFALGIELEVTGVDHLQHKESNRWQVIQTELDKFNQSLPQFKTHNDHRMAMSLSALSVIKPIEIDDLSVVSKSFPDFWQEVAKLGINLTH